MSEEFLKNIGFTYINMELTGFLHYVIYPLLLAFIIKLIYKSLNFDYLKTMFGLVVFAISTYFLLLNFINNEINKSQDKIISIQSSTTSQIEKNKIIKEKKTLLN